MVSPMSVLPSTVTVPTSRTSKVWATRTNRGTGASVVVVEVVVTTGSGVTVVGTTGSGVAGSATTGSATTGSGSAMMSTGTTTSITSTMLIAVSATTLATAVATSGITGTSTMPVAWAPPTEAAATVVVRSTLPTTVPAKFNSAGNIFLSFVSDAWRSSTDTNRWSSSFGSAGSMDAKWLRIDSKMAPSGRLVALPWRIFSTSSSFSGLLITSSNDVDGQKGTALR